MFTRPGKYHFRQSGKHFGPKKIYMYATHLPMVALPLDSVTYFPLSAPGNPPPPPALYPLQPPLVKIETLFGPPLRPNPGSANVIRAEIAAVCQYLLIQSHLINHQPSFRNMQRNFNIPPKLVISFSSLMHVVYIVNGKMVNLCFLTCTYIHTHTV